MFDTFLLIKLFLKKNVEMKHDAPSNSLMDSIASPNVNNERRSWGILLGS
jgi:hypothetical protein